MQRQASWLSNRIVIAVVGALVVGSLGAVFAVNGLPRHVSTQTGSAPGNGSTSTTAPSPTVPVANGTITVVGTITSIEPLNGQFSILEETGATQTIDVTNQTQFTGNATSLNDLQTGTQVSVTGTQQSDGTLSATTVDVTDDA
jgi:hypothetical protein